MKFMKTYILLIAMLFTPLLATAAPGDIQFDSSAETEVETVNDKGEKILLRQPATLVIPGTIVIYTNKASNNGTETVEGVVISNPVPENTEYLAGSAVGENTQITYSVDGGKNFDVPEQLTVKHVDGTTRPAEANEYTHIRWVLGTPIPPGGEGQVEFRTKVQ